MLFLPVKQLHFQICGDRERLSKEEVAVQVIPASFTVHLPKRSVHVTWNKFDERSPDASKGRERAPEGKGSAGRRTWGGKQKVQRRVL